MIMIKSALLNALRRDNRVLSDLRRDKRGVAFIEFAFAAPIVLSVSCYGMELGSLALARTQLSQLTMNIADNMSRVGLDNGLSLVQIRESDVNDTFTGAKLAGGDLKVTTFGRIILSSLQRNSSGGQWITWQRCKGLKNVASSWGVQGTGATGTAFAGMGPAGAIVTAPAGSAVMVVELQYDYQPLFPLFWSTSGASTGTFTAVFKDSQKLIKYNQAYIVRDQRDLTQIYNPPNPLTGQIATPSSCSTFSV